MPIKYLCVCVLAKYVSLAPAPMLSARNEGASTI